MEEKNLMVPYIVYEGEQTRNERTIKRLSIAIVIAIIAIVFSNAMWLWAWMQYDYVYEDTVTVDTEGAGNASYIGNDGVIVNGESGSYQQTDENSEQ